MIRNIRLHAFEFSEEQVRTVRMEGGPAMTRDELRETIAQALDAAQEYCDNAVPPDLEGHLFINADDCPIEADQAALDNGIATAVPLSNFAPLPRIGEV